VVHPDDPRLLAPDDMPSAIADLCRESGQPVPASHGGVIRCALESLALRYRQVLGMLEALTGGRIETVHIVGGGSQNELLSQMAADATGRPVVTGPVEATAIGNVLVQALAAGEIGSIGEAREVVRSSFEVKEYAPRDIAQWTDAAEKLG
jgi:rhamnulokinase